MQISTIFSGLVLASLTAAAPVPAVSRSSNSTYTTEMYLLRRGQRECGFVKTLREDPRYGKQENYGMDDPKVVKTEKLLNVPNDRPLQCEKLHDVGKFFQIEVKDNGDRASCECDFWLYVYQTSASFPTWCIHLLTEIQRTWLRWRVSGIVYQCRSIGWWWLGLPHENV